jgi:hypothetical protein
MWITMKRKKNSTLQRCMLLTKCPNDERCHQDGPFRLRMRPLMTTTASDASAPMPNT